jgi:hypothetical protein
MLRTFGRLVERHGPVFGIRLPIGLGMAVMVAHPDAVERVLRSNGGNYIKGLAYDGARLLLGEGLVTASKSGCPILPRVSGRGRHFGNLINS